MTYIKPSDTNRTHNPEPARTEQTNDSSTTSPDESPMRGGTEMTRALLQQALNQLPANNYRLRDAIRDHLANTKDVEPDAVVRVDYYAGGLMEHVEVQAHELPQGVHKLYLSPTIPAGMVLDAKCWELSKQWLDESTQRRVIASANAMLSAAKKGE